MMTQRASNLLSYGSIALWRGGEGRLGNSAIDKELQKSGMLIF